MQEYFWLVTNSSEVLLLNSCFSIDCDFAAINADVTDGLSRLSKGEMLMRIRRSSSEVTATAADNESSTAAQGYCIPYKGI